MKQHFDATFCEKKWYDFWCKEQYFGSKTSKDGKVFSMVIPPPNVTGTLHMGHAFQLSIMDLLWRYHQMNGEQSLWQLGLDHAGIATQLVVENFLKQQGENRSNLTQEEFLAKVFEWKDYSSKNITDQQKRIGISGDWENLRFTLDPEFNQAVIRVFTQLYEEGFIYRGKRLVNWDPVLKTAISDLEVLNEETQGEIWYIRYQGKAEVIIATTRPETIFGDVAIAVNPTDPRYKHLVGEKVKIPLTNREIPIIADSYVDLQFGTGCVKITPAHDFNDYAVGQRHNLACLNILTPDGRLNEVVPSEFQGLSTLDARAKIVKALLDLGLLVKTEKHTYKIPKGDRSGAIIEPYLTDQWFVKMKTLVAPAIEAVKTGRLKFVPENWNKVYLRWLENIEDWCISRQLWWGHQIPAWYDEKGQVYVGKDEEEIITKNPEIKGKLIKDPDVLDTWFSAALWPFVSLGWPEDKERFKKFYPTSVLVTGFDIIFFWVARMVVMGLKFTNEIPFKTVYITGLIRDGRGQKMSKSKGNVIDPVDLIDGISLEDLLKKRTSFLMQSHLIGKIEKETQKDFPDGIVGCGADALRFTLTSLATMNMNINFQMEKLVSNRHFITKMWNAARYILQQISSTDDYKKAEFNEVDIWIKQEFNILVEQVKNWINDFRFDLAGRAVYEFLWNQFCDWYLEFAKVILNSSLDVSKKLGTKITLITIMEKFLRLIHPMTPFISEELWQKFKNYGDYSNCDSILLTDYPKVEASFKDENYATVEWVKEVITELRNLKSEFGLSDFDFIYLKSLDSPFVHRLEVLKKYLVLTRLGAFKPEFNLDTGYASVVKEGIELVIQISEERLNREKERLQGELDNLVKNTLKITDKLRNSSYLDKAPSEIIERDQKRLKEDLILIEKIKVKLKNIR